MTIPYAQTSTFTRVQHFDANQHGRDFVVGDIHGCFDAVRDAMAAHGFDKERDRLFSVGDLVDRGTQCEECVDWIAQSWFHAVRGNHEQMAIEVAQGRHSIPNYVQNGGGWFVALPEDRRKLIANCLATLPFAIEIAHSLGTIGIVHAEVVGNDWRGFTDALEVDTSNNKFRNLAECALWMRDRITKRDCSPVANARRVYVGHTPLAEYSVLGNVYYIDTGAVFGKKLTMLEIA